MNVHMKDKKVWIPLVILVGIAVAGLWFPGFSREETVVVDVQEATAKKGDLTIDLLVDGILELNTVNLQFGTSGVLNQLLVSEGDRVEPGQVIAILDDSNYSSEVTIASTRLQKALADKEKLVIQYSSMTEVPEAYAQADILLKEIDLANSSAGVTEAQASLSQAMSNQSDTVLKAPYAGTIVQINGELGEVISSTTNEGGAFVILSEEKVVVTAKVLELEIGDVSIGQLARVTVEAYPEAPISGTVTNIAYLPTTDSNGIVSYEVTIELTDPAENLRHGMTCTASLILKEVQDVVIIPNKAVKMIDGKQMVEVALENGETSQKQIKTGFTDGYNVEVKEGLEPGDKVLIRTETVAL